MKSSSKTMLVFLAFGMLFAGTLAIVLIPQAEAAPPKHELRPNPGFEPSGERAPEYVPPSIIPR